MDKYKCPAKKFGIEIRFENKKRAIEHFNCKHCLNAKYCTGPAVV